MAITQTASTALSSALNSKPALGAKELQSLMGPASASRKEAEMAATLNNMKAQLEGLKAQIKDLKAHPHDQFTASGGGCVKPASDNWQPKDLGALVEMNKLGQTSGPISAEQFADSIEAAVGDLDGQAASSEYRTVADWAANNRERLTPEARQVMDIYSKYAALSQARGDSGIPQGDFKKMLAEMRDVGDASAKKALANLDSKTHGGTVSGQDMARAIQTGTADHDGQAAGAELKEFEKWAAKNQSRLSPEAKEVLDVYRKHTKAAQAQGRSGLTDQETAALNKEMRRVGSGDVSARKATEALDKQHGPISGEDLTQAIREGISDTDAHSTTSELKEFEKWAAKNESRLTPEAKEVLKTYQAAAKKAGPDGLTQKEADAMFKAMGRFQTFHDSSMRDALEGLDAKSGKISGSDLTAAIEKGAGDLDGQAAGTEFTDTMKWARMNYDRLTPEAKKVVDTYEKYATRAQASGSTGIDPKDFKKMINEMKFVSNPRPPRPLFIAA
ncbi:hypothetical protein [Corallococcus sp. Z5C101001]|uniref:hypothetical protein n=1 Tax=Corallococcus sp. Z5C101001 TaxID=2596829 RepID=UPI00117D1426|nr:hypothetical protein [Corallococcus sp. Z5C101001]TSC23223.1 hypothetical protein FOF48_31530 [Corallococcus sp. Z5C101001]